MPAETLVRNTRRILKRLARLMHKALAVNTSIVAFTGHTYPVRNLCRLMLS